MSFPKEHLLTYPKHILKFESEEPRYRRGHIKIPLLNEYEKLPSQLPFRLGKTQRGKHLKIILQTYHIQISLKYIYLFC